MTSSLRPPYHHDVSTNFRRLAAAVLLGLAAALVFRPAPSRAETELISAPAALELQHRQAVTIVDIRRPEEWRQSGYPSGAERATIRSRTGERGFLDRIAAITGGNKAAPLALICATGVRSKLATEILRRAGYRNVVDIGEGMFGSARGVGWMARQLPLSRCADC
ncbi:MAG: rhodanese-like domain-containing protein [Alphaproteobacteria bacterium]|nr:rhodanese-like domain-containing protein [Alphaproteobacteria bacterium]